MLEAWAYAAGQRSLAGAVSRAQDTNRLAEQIAAQARRCLAEI